MAGAVIQATGRTKLEDGLWIGGQLKSRNGLHRVHMTPGVLPWADAHLDLSGQGLLENGQDTDRQNF